MNQLPKLKRVIVQYASNLKIVPPFQFLLKPVGHVLVLQNVETRPEFLHYCSHNWPSVLIANQGTRAQRFNNIHFLEADPIIVNGVTFAKTDSVDWPNIVISEHPPNYMVDVPWIYRIGKNQLTESNVVINTEGPGFRRDAIISIIV